MWRRIARRIAGLASAAAVLLLSRWSLRIAAPAEDLAAVRRAIWHIEATLGDYWATLRRAYGPVTDDMQSAWEQLRDRYRGGSYGVEGT